MFICVIFVSFSVWVARPVQASTLYAGAARETVQVGDTFVVEWFLDSQNQEINTVHLKLSFTTDTLEALEATPGGSAFVLWAQYPEFSNSTGVLALTGGAPGGLRGDNIPIFRTTFRAKTAGRASVTMDESSQVLLSDGQGTADALSFRVLDFAVSPEGSWPIEITSPTHPDQGLWYRERRVAIKFFTSEKEEYSYSFSSNLEIFPDDIPDPLSQELVFENLPDGVYYFRLNSRVGNSNWQESGGFRVQVDATPPESFQPVVGNQASVFGGQPFVSASTVDKTSGISYYKFKSGLVRGTFVTAEPQKISRLFFGNTIEVQAFDRAGNAQTAIVAYPGLFRWQFVLAVAAVVVVIIAAIVRRKFKKTKQGEESAP
ncbi:MAG: hypothetical protein HY397_03735 [Candidatus Doudnabacteria bacterium]|nr:hypothetical protein [Candidatus Doudnabacteria bacterium]